MGAVTDVFRDLVVIGRRLQFGWHNSPGVRCLFASALEYSRVHTSCDDAVITESGRDATADVKVTRPEAIGQLVSLPRGCQTSRGTGGGILFIVCSVLRRRRHYRGTSMVSIRLSYAQRRQLRWRPITFACLVSGRWERLPSCRPKKFFRGTLGGKR